MEQNKSAQKYSHDCDNACLSVFLVQYGPCGRKCAFKGYAHGRQQ